MRANAAAAPYPAPIEEVPDHERNHPTNRHSGAGSARPPVPAVPGMPCQRKSPGDHLARYLDAYTASELTRAYMAAVLGELVVLTHGAIVPDGAR